MTDPVGVDNCRVGGGEIVYEDIDVWQGRLESDLVNEAVAGLVEELE